MSSTLAAALPSGSATTSVNPFPIPTLPASASQAPDESSFNLEPFTSIIKFFNDSPGGFGMPLSNTWGFLAILGIVGAGVMTYIAIKNFFVAYIVVLMLTCLGVGLHLTQLWLVGIEVLIGLGIWAVERYAQ
jgi:hypothetical protein